MMAVAFVTQSIARVQGRGLSIVCGRLLLTELSGMLVRVCTAVRGFVVCAGVRCLNSSSGLLLKDRLKTHSSGALSIE